MRHRDERPALGWHPDPPSPQARALLFGLPYPGFGATMYRRWPGAAGDVEICPVRLPARENCAHEPPPPSYPEIAEALTKALGPHLDRAFGFFGHGAGALVGYEAAVRLSGPCGPAPHRLCVSTEAAPHHGPRNRLSRMAGRDFLAQISRLAGRAYGDQFRMAVESSGRTLHADVGLAPGAPIYQPLTP